MPTPACTNKSPTRTRKIKLPKRPSSRLRLARHGEQRALDYLVSLGYQVVARNWRSPETRNELDLIVQDGVCLVFVEVKTARSATFGDPLYWITPRKQSAIIRAATSYLAIESPAHSEFRFDTITIAASDDKKKNAPLVHTKSAFIAEGD